MVREGQAEAGRRKVVEGSKGLHEAQILIKQLCSLGLEGLWEAMCSA